MEANLFNYSNYQTPRRVRRRLISHNINLSNPLPNEIMMGDEVFINVRIGNNVVSEFYTSSASCKEDIIKMIRCKCKDFSGLGRFYMRNKTQGWSCERSIMLYA